MTEDRIFNTQEEELRRVATEIHETKELLRTVLQSVSRMETRLKRAFPNQYPTIKRSPKTPEGQQFPTLTKDQVLGLYNELVDTAKDSGMERAKDRLTDLGQPDLNLLREELGAPLSGKKPSKRAVIEAIMGRVRESIMMTKHVSREPNTSSETPQ